MRYHRLNNQEPSGEADGTEMSEVISPMANTERGELAKLVGMTVKILYRERTYEISCLTPETTVARLKELVASSTEIEQSRVRLIFSGRALAPDDKTLAFFKIEHQSSIHLFPLPVAVPAVASPAVASPYLNPQQQQQQQRQAIFGADVGATSFHTPAHFDPMVVVNSREVKVWSLVLIFLSSMALFNNVSYFTSTGACPLA